MRFELVRQKLAALPQELPPPPEAVIPIRLDSPDPLFPPGLEAGREAAVLVLLFPDEAGEARVLLTERPPHLASHAGEVSFPGGSAEPEDTDAVMTAIREAAEEVGLDPSACGLTVAGALEQVVIPVSGFRITPVLALAERRPGCTANPEEVLRILEPPVETFMPDAPIELEERVIRERLIRYGVYPVEGARVWGATARMLGQLGALLASETR
jgi:8-oxo-dGTP pyrophosphatase MutT (NUDIX family)